MVATANLDEKLYSFDNRQATAIIIPQDYFNIIFFSLIIFAVDVIVYAIRR